MTTQYGGIWIHHVNEYECVFEWRGGPIARVSSHMYPRFADWLEGGAFPWDVEVLGKDDLGDYQVRRKDGWLQPTA